LIVMPDLVRLLVPSDERFRTIGPELAGKYCAASGGTDSDVQALTTAVEQAVGDLTTGAAADHSLSLDLSAPVGRVEVALSCGGRSSVVTHPLPTTRDAPL
jgi:hypothetical protein